MPANKSAARGRGGRCADRGSQGFRLPLTVSNNALLEGNSDRRFRGLIYNLLTLANAITRVRDALARRIGVSGPQYGMLMAIAHLHDGRGASVRAVAARLHVSGAFVTAEAGKLVRQRLLVKSPDPRDGRGVLLSLAPRARTAIESNADAIRAINDRFFSSLKRDDFLALSRILEVLAADGARSLAHLAAPAMEPAAVRRLASR